MNQLTDNQLFICIQQDDESAFEELLLRYSSRIYRLVFRHTRHAEATKDILQDVFLGVWKNRHKIKIEDSIYPYLYRAAKNAVIDHALTNSRNISLDTEQYEQYPGYGISAEEKLYLKEIELAFQRSVNKMPETMRTVMILSREHKLSAREIAAQLNISEQTVRNNISLALKSLRKSLGLSGLLFLIPASLFFEYLVTLS